MSSTSPERPCDTTPIAQQATHAATLRRIVVQMRDHAVMTVWVDSVWADVGGFLFGCRDSKHKFCIAAGEWLYWHDAPVEPAWREELEEPAKAAPVAATKPEAEIPSGIAAVIMRRNWK